MGLITSRRNSGASDVDATNGSAYKYPPKSGGYYFAGHFVMGGERFESTKQDTYLFGENEELNFLGNRPFPFPYPAPQPREPTKTLRCLVNIRKDSVRFVRDLDGNHRCTSDGDGCEGPRTCYNVEFTFDTDVKCAITIYYFATEEIVSKQAMYHPRDAKMNSETFHYKRGANQVFSQPTHVVDPSQFNEGDWQYRVEKEIYPVVIQCVVEEEGIGDHSHTTFAAVERSQDGGYTLKPLKQKQMVDGLCYLLQEIYGIENKNMERAKLDDDFEDNGAECVICMCEMRDTLILPCRHLCLCSGCADNLRYQASNCPICRVKFCALLQLRAIRKKMSCPLTLGSQPADTYEESHGLSQDGVPHGYEAVSLIEALNGPPSLPQPSGQFLPGIVVDNTLQSMYAAMVGGVAISSTRNATPAGTPVTDDETNRTSFASELEVGVEERESSESSSGSSVTLSPDYMPPPGIKLTWVVDHPLALEETEDVKGRRKGAEEKREILEEGIICGLHVKASSVSSSFENMSEFSSSRESLSTKESEDKLCTVLSLYKEETDTDDVTPARPNRQPFVAPSMVSFISDVASDEASDDAASDDVVPYSAVDPLQACAWVDAVASGNEAKTTSSSTKNLLDYVGSKSEEPRENYVTGTLQGQDSTIGVAL